MNAQALRAVMKELLDRSAGLNRTGAEEYLYMTILRQLTPDEARILATLADGSSFPVIDVCARTPLGGAGRIILRNASTIGPFAGVSLPDQVPAYLTRLAGFGLAEIGGEEQALDSQYEILATDELVREAGRTVKRARFLRRTVRISRLGARFWAACDPADVTSRASRALPLA